MGNFGFVRTTLPTVHSDCARAESYLTTDPRAVCMYSRRAIEGLVAHLYAVLALKPPYRNDLAAHIDDAVFKTKVGLGIIQKLTLIRKVGNTAVHKQLPVSPFQPRWRALGGAAWRHRDE